MSKHKVFSESGAFVAPDVITLVGDETHHRQVSMYVVAATKVAGAALFAAAGSPEWVGKDHMKHAGVMPEPYSNEFGAAVEYEVISLDEPGIYVFSMNHGRGIARLTADGPVIVGHILSRRFGNYEMEKV